jgi:hypothetical protein
MNASTTTRENAMHLDLTDNERATLIAQRLGATHALAYPGDNLPSRFNLDLPDAGVPNARLFLHFSPYHSKGRVVISCIFPQCPGYGSTNARTFLRPTEIEEMKYVPSITVADTKTSEQIAADVQRRLLPGYLKVLASVNASIAKQVKQQEEKTALLQRLAGVAGVFMDTESLKRERIHLYDGKRILDVDLSGSSVNVDLKWISAELAEKVIALFKAST